MIKIILKLIVEILGKRLIKAGLEEELLKNQKYITAAKNIWNIINEDFRISDTIENKLRSKADEFDRFLLAKFPELAQSDVVELRQSIAGEVNAGKEVVLSQVDAFKQLQDANTQLQVENTEIKNQLSQIQSAVTSVVS